MTKKNRCTRLFSALLALVMLLSLFPAHSFATEKGEPVTEDITPGEEQENALVSAPSPRKEETLSEEKAPTKRGEDYLAGLDRLPALVPVNELVDLSQYVFLEMAEHNRIMDLEGLFYFVTQVTEGDETGYYIVDPSSPTIHERVAATPVQIVDNRVVGADPEMALELIHDTTAQGNNRWEHRIKLRGDYDDLEIDYYLTPSLDADSSALCRTKSILDFGLALRQGPEDGGRESLYFYRSLSYTGEDGETVVGACHIRYATDTDGNKYFHRAPLPETFGEGNLFKVYRLLTDRVNVENLLDMLNSLRKDLPFHEKYDQETYDSFLSAVQEAMDLYTAYNGRVFSAEEDSERAEAQAQVDSLTKEIMSLRSQLRISRNTGNQGSEIRYVDSTVYRWDETNMNKLTMELEDYDQKGFFFTSITVPGQRPHFSRWNAKKAYENLQGPDGKELQATVQQWGIHSRLTKKDLNGSLDPLDPDVAVSADLWGKESIDGAKSVYTKVGLPFVYDIETGYYEMNSDKNAVFFGEEPESGVKMVIADRPCAYSLNASGFEVCEDPQTYVYADPTTHKVYDRYIAGFQPFSPVTPFEWKSFPGDAGYTGGIDSLTTAYLLDGISWISQAVPDPNPNDFGTATWGFGMMVEFTFRMTESGTIIYTDASGARHEVPITFEFSGDDDIWVYIDDKLAMDIGGTHDAIQGRIDFQTGNVTLRSDKFKRIIDLRDFYTQNHEDTNYTYSASGSILGEMYEENIYTGKIGPETAQSASEGRYATLADGKDHVMRIYYMDRGKGKTNCAIRFNLPKTDILTVEKKIDPYYQGDSSKGSLPTALYENLTKKVYTFTLLENGEPVANMPYYLTRNGFQVGSGVTNGEGRFTLRGDQIAEFRNMNFAASKTYSVVEEELSPVYWGTEHYTYSYSGSEIASSASGTGNSYAADGDTGSIETLSFVCTNIYVHTINLDPDPQAVVLDYGKPIEVEVVRNAVITGASEIWVRQATLLSLSFADSSDRSYGTTTLLDKDGNKKADSFRFTLTKMLDKVVTIHAKLEIPFEDGSIHTVELPIHMIPATQVYYETDFADGVFSLNAVGTDKLWQSFGSPQEELQDEGNVDDQLYDFYIDRGKIPSNAFFTDFDGRGMEERYQKHLLYTGHDFDREETYISTTDRISSLELYEAAGVMVATLGVNSKDGDTYYSRYIHTRIPGATNARSRPLNFTPGPNDYLQMRFRLENCEVETGLDYIGVTLNVLRSDEPDSVDITGKTAPTVFLKKQHADLMAGKFVTVTVPLSGYQRYVQAPNIEAFSFHLERVQIKANTTAKIYYDYIYVGPLTEKNGEKGQSHEIGADALFFDFKNDSSATLRYSGSQYGDISKDTNTYWTTTYSPDSAAASPTITKTGDGYVTLNVSDTQHSSNHKTGPYLYMTNTAGKIGAADEDKYGSYWPLDYTVPDGKLYYHVRCSFKNVEYSQGGADDPEPYIQMSIIGRNANNEAVFKHPKYTFKISDVNNKGYKDFKIDVTSYVASMETIEAIYLRFTNVAPSGSSNGTILVDYLYLGPEEDSDKIRQMQETSIYFGFNNTDADKQRYSGTVYSAVNADIKNNWTNHYFTPEIENGMLKLTPTTNQKNHETGYGSTYLIPSDTSSLNYKMTGNDVLEIRLRFVNAKKHPNTKVGYGRVKICFGDESAPYTSKTLEDGTKQEAERYDWKVEDTDLISGNWVTYKIDLADYTWKHGEADTIRFITPIVQDVDFGNNGYVLIDYIYLGPKVDAKPKCESLFFGFENEEIDQGRYESDTYSNHNYDLLPATGDAEGFTTDPALNSNAFSYTIDNEIGLLTLEVTDKLSTENIRGPYLTTSDLYDHGEFRSSNQYTVEYVPENAEYMQIRFRTNNCVKSDNAPRDMNVIFLYDGYDKDGNYVDFNTYNGEAYIRGYYEAKDKFQVLTMPLTEAIRDMLMISNFGIRFQHMSSDGGGTVDIDYIYVGPGELAPDPVYGYDSSYEDATYPEDVLFFGFENEEGDRQRYASEIYGGLNHDFVDHEKKVGYWATNGNLYEPINYCAYSIDNQTGELRLQVGDKPLDTGTYGPILITVPKYGGTYGFNGNNMTLRYSAASAEVFRIRFRLEKCVGREGEETVVQFMIGGRSANGSFSTVTLSKALTITNEYQVLDVSLGTELQNLQYISNLGLRFRNVISTEKGYIDIDYIYVGPEEMAPPKEEQNHVAEFSNGSSYFAEGAGVKTLSNTKTYTEASFTFTGTGFDIISRTGKEQATIRVEVQDAATGAVMKTITVNNKGEMELSQIPVVSVHGMPHGNYKVFIWVNKAVTSSLPILSRGGQFYFDALRIYDPVDVSKEEGLLTTHQKLSLDAYGSDKEAHDYVKEIRDILLSVAEFQDVTFGNSTSGALFVDSKEPETNLIPEGAETDPGEPLPTETADMVRDHLALTVRDYNKVGPKNEVYLSPGEAVVFKLVLSATRKPVSIDIGAKTILTDEGSLAAGFVSVPDSSADTLEVLSRIEEKLVTSTGMYYDLDLSTLPTSQDVYLVLYNAYEGRDKARNILSVTDLKVAYKETPTEVLPEDDNTGTGDTEIKPEKRRARVLEEPYSFAVDSQTLEAAAVFMNAVIESHKAETPIVHDGAKLRHSLNLASDIALNYLVAKKELADYENISLEVQIPVYHSNGEMTYRLQTILPEDRGTDYYYFTLESLTAVNMSDVMVATLYMEKDGRAYCSEADEYSIGDYAYSQLNSSVAPDELKRLCAELLRYGAFAQRYKGYRRDSLADAHMTESHKTYLSDMEAVAFGNTNRVLDDLPNAPITWVGKALSLESKVALRFVFSPGGYTGAISDLRLRISYTDGNGMEKTAFLTDPAPYGQGNYEFTVNTLLAAELRTVLSVQIYAGDSPVSSTLQYSADTYGNNKTGLLSDLCKALFAYSDSAKAYFTP